MLLFIFCFGLFFGAYFSQPRQDKSEKGIEKTKRKASELVFGKKAAYSPSKDIEKQIFHIDRTYSYFDTDDKQN